MKIDFADRPGCDSTSRIPGRRATRGLLFAAVTFAALAMAVPAASSASTLATGGRHTCGVTASGGVSCWGENSKLQLGNPSWGDTATPTPVSGLGGTATAVTAGYDHTCAIVQGAAKCWGSAEEGQLGNGLSGNVSQSTPQQVAGLSSGVTSIDAGDYHTCAVHAGGVKCWGSSSNDQLGSVVVGDFAASPVSVTGLAAGVISVASGAHFSCALLVTGGVKCWGANWSGELGDGTNDDSATPVAVTGLTNAVALAAGSDHACALLATGGVKCWGSNWKGQLGNGTTSESSIPVTVTGLGAAATSIETGWSHTCAIVDSAAKCWGGNNKGALGNGGAVDSPVPVSVSGGARPRSSLRDRVIPAW